MIDVGIVGVGTYLPEKTMKAAEIARLTNGVWSEDAVINKLGIKQRYLPGPDDGTQEMGAKAALKCLENTGVDPKEIDVILCIGEEWKEYPLTTSACYIQDRIGATNAWGIDVQNRCCTCVSAMKIAADMLRADDEINTIMICGGYRNGDFVDFTDKDMSMMYNLSAGGGAIILKKNYGKNLLLGSKIMSDGSLARTAFSEMAWTQYDNVKKSDVYRIGCCCGFPHDNHLQPVQKQHGTRHACHEKQHVGGTGYGYKSAQIQTARFCSLYGIRGYRRHNVYELPRIRFANKLDAHVLSQSACRSHYRRHAQPVGNDCRLLYRIRTDSDFLPGHCVFER